MHTRTDPTSLLAPAPPLLSDAEGVGVSVLGSHVAMPCQADPTYVHRLPVLAARSLGGTPQLTDDLRRIISGLAGLCPHGRCELDIFHSARMLLSDVLNCTVTCVPSLPY